MLSAARLHRYLGWGLGLWLTLLCLSGALLLYKNSLLRLNYPALAAVAPVSDIQQWGPLLQKLQQDSNFRYVKFPDADAHWLEAVTFDNQRYYFDGNRQLLLTRPVHADWIDWVYDFHLHLLGGKTGHTVNGVIGLLSVALLLCGLWQWWPRRFSRRLFTLPEAGTSLRSLRQYHSLLALLLLPLLLLTSATGAMMVFSQQTRTVLSAVLGQDQHPFTPVSGIAPVALELTDWPRALATATAHWPAQQLRLVSFRRKAQDVISFRAKAEDEWHPNGRGVLQLHPASYQLMYARAAADLSPADKVRNSFYPLHVASIGGVLYKILLLLSGVSCLLLFALGLSYSWQRLKARSARYDVC